MRVLVVCPLIAARTRAVAVDAILPSGWVRRMPGLYDDDQVVCFFCATIGPSLCTGGSSGIPKSESWTRLLQVLPKAGRGVLITGIKLTTTRHVSLDVCTWVPG